MRCEICPRRCNAERTAEKAGGVCRMPAGLVVARAMLHLWEEPVLSGKNGAGCIFFSGCNLGCVFCQNGRISHENFGKVITPAHLREIMEGLVSQGAHCIDLVTPTHFTPWVLEALKEPLPVPVVWNSGGYERVETLRTLEGKVQIYLPDLKYAMERPARELSAAPEGKFVRICVTDNGPGIPEESRDKLFDMFYTLGKTRSDGRRGLGLGLALCRSIVAAHGGVINVQNVAPHGACFRFTLPRTEVTLYE